MNPQDTDISLRPYRPRWYADLRRFGNRADGGYVLPQCAVDASEALLSLGVEADWSFEAAVLAVRPTLRLTCVDGTSGPAAIRARLRRDLLKALRQLRPRKLVRVLGNWNKPEQFRAFFAHHEFLPLMVTAAGGPGRITLPALLAQVRGGNAACRVLVKMDIEGGEYEVLRAAADALDGVTGLAIEFHDLAGNWSRFRDIMALLQPRFHIAHVHGNNNDGVITASGVPETLEITLVNRRVGPPDPPPSSAVYPIAGLDFPNRPRRPDLALSFE